MGSSGPITSYAYQGILLAYDLLSQTKIWINLVHTTPFVKGTWQCTQRYALLSLGDSHFFSHFVKLCKGFAVISAKPRYGLALLNRIKQ